MTRDQILEGLDEAQRQAVLHDTGPCLCLAGAGSGKTRVLTRRTARLISDGVPPSRILCVTFTRKAGDEMRSRLEPLIGKEAAGRVNIGTFHAQFWRNLLIPVWMERGDNRAYAQAMEAREGMRLVREVLKDQGFYDVEPAPILRLVSLLKLNRLGPEAGLDKWHEAAHVVEAAVSDTNLPPAVCRSIYGNYEQRKQVFGMIDFDDMIFLADRLLQDEGLRRRFQAKWDYILVDEFQDTNPLQYAIIKALAEQHRNVFCVGDDWQSIFSFQGATVQNILHFERDWPGAAVIPLATNYRSTASIVDPASRLMEHAVERRPKQVRAHRPAGAAPEVVMIGGQEEEAGWISDTLADQHAGGTPWKDMAVLYRTNAQCEAIESALVRANIPFVTTGQTGFYARREVQDILSYLRLAADSGDNEALRRAIAAPPRFLGAKFMEALEAHARATGRGLYGALPGVSVGPRQRGSVEQFSGLIERLRQMIQAGQPPAALITLVRRESGYDKKVRKEGADDSDNDRLDNLNALEQAAGRFATVAEMLDFARKMEQLATSKDAQADAVCLSTIHKAKGLEWRCVVVAGCSERLLPHAKATADEKVEEERRLMYVALTRAMDRVWCVSPAEIWGKSAAPSPFLEEAGLIQAAPVPA